MSANIAMSATSSEKRRMLVLFCSPHRAGHTGRLLQAFLERLPEDVEVTVYDAYRERPQPCLDCGYCTGKQGCSQRDLDAFMEAFEQADFFVVASPVYYNALPAPGKAVLDRFQRYFSARFALGIRPPVASPKRAALLLSCGSGERGGFLAVRSQLRRAFTVMNTELCGSVFAGGTDSAPLGEAAFLRAKRLAHKMAGAGDTYVKG
ncbi:MAG TPA: flavodoxin family protein [Candidatus Fimivicinus intestinavium]|nr:flavodoxin family protein [Candidatus Fimivicinus intestinavium]